MIHRLDALTTGARRARVRPEVATDPRPRPAVVVAAVDLSEEPRRSRRVLEAAAALSAGARSALHVVYGWRLVGASILACPTRGLSAESMRSLVARERQRHREGLMELCDEVLSTRPAGILVRRGDPRAVIPDAVRALRADLLVLGGGSSSGLAGLLLGGVARAVVDRVSCDVLTVRNRYPW